MPWTPATVVPRSICSVKFAFWALVKCDIVANCCLAVFFASFNRASPFNAVLAVFTRCNACSTATLLSFEPAVLSNNVLAAVTASLYAVCLSLSASVYFWAAFVAASSLIPRCKLLIAVFNSDAIVDTWFTPATVVAPSICDFNAAFCALLIDVRLFNAFFAVVLAFATFWLPFNSFLARCTFCNAVSTPSFAVFGPCALFKICSACVTAFVYALRFASSASVKLTPCLIVFWSWIPFFKFVIAVFNASALFCACVTSLTCVAPSIWRFAASFCALVKSLKPFKCCFAFVCAVLKFSWPFNACCLAVTWSFAWLISCAIIDGLVVWPMIAFAAVTALL